MLYYLIGVFIILKDLALGTNTVTYPRFGSIGAARQSRMPMPRTLPS